MQRSSDDGSVQTQRVLMQAVAHLESEADGSTADLLAATHHQPQQGGQNTTLLYTATNGARSRQMHTHVVIIAGISTRH